MCTACGRIQLAGQRVCVCVLKQSDGALPAPVESMLGNSRLEFPWPHSRHSLPPHSSVCECVCVRWSICPVLRGSAAALSCSRPVPEQGSSLQLHNTSPTKTKVQISESARLTLFDKECKHITDDPDCIK